MDYRLAERLQAYKDSKEYLYPCRLIVYKFGTELVGRGEGKDRHKRYTDSPDHYGDIVLKSSDRGLPRWCEDGWYADTYQNDVLEYGVCRIRTPKGCLYVAVTWHTDCDGATYHFDDSILMRKGPYITEDHERAILDVLRYANRCAELEAEKCRDDDAKFQAEQAIEYAREEIQSLRDKTRDLLHERRELKGLAPAPAICETIRQKVSQNISRVAELRENISKWSDDYWSAVPNW